MQRRLDVVDRWQRERHPSVKGRPRLEAPPGLAHSGRTYDRASEPRTWELPKVWELMGTHRVPRHVDGQGKLSVSNRPDSAGVAWAGQQVWVGFDPLAGAWTFQDDQGHEVRRQLGAEVMAMELTNRRRGAHAAKPPVRIPEAKPTSRCHKSCHTRKAEIRRHPRPTTGVRRASVRKAHTTAASPAG